MRFGKTILAAMILALTVTGAASFGANTSEELAETGAWVMKPVESSVAELPTLRLVRLRF